MHEEKFKELIYRLCDDFIGEEILFLGFRTLWGQSSREISQKDLTTLTSSILNDLVGKRVLREVREPSSYDSDIPFDSPVPYPIYVVLPHEKLIKE